MDPRFNQINELFIQYSLGNFDYRLEPTEKLDDIDAFISSINMLGEELKDTTISKNYFNNIFNSVSDMLFVLDNNGILMKLNDCSLNTLEFSQFHPNNINIDDIAILPDKSSFLNLIKNKLQNEKKFAVESNILTNKKNIIPAYCTSSFIYDETRDQIGYLIRAQNLTTIKSIQNSLKQSEEKYRKIFDESSDCIFITDITGNFIDLNKAGKLFFEQSEKNSQNYFSFFKNIKDKIGYIQELRIKNYLIDFQTQLKIKDEVVECLISTNAILDEKSNLVGFQGIIKNITKQKETENLVVRTITDTQEKERIRFAKDIHDSLGQQLSAIKFYLATLIDSDEFMKKNLLLTKSNEALTSVLNDMRNICFNLMPKTLENLGLVKAVNELCIKMESKGILNFYIKTNNNFPSLDRSIEFSIYRVVQEFISNSIKHGKAKNIFITFKKKRNNIAITLKDDGIGFDTSIINKSSGMGFTNILSRIQSYNGDIKIRSKKNKGTEYEILIPYLT